MCAMRPAHVACVLVRRAVARCLLATRPVAATVAVVVAPALVVVVVVACAVAVVVADVAAAAVVVVEIVVVVVAEHDSSCVSSDYVCTYMFWCTVHIYISSAWYLDLDPATTVLELDLDLLPALR